MPGPVRAADRGEGGTEEADPVLWRGLRRGEFATLAGGVRHAGGGQWRTGCRSASGYPVSGYDAAGGGVRHFATVPGTWQSTCPDAPREIVPGEAPPGEPETGGQEAEATMPSSLPQSPITNHHRTVNARTCSNCRSRGRRDGRNQQTTFGHRHPTQRAARLVAPALPRLPGAVTTRGSTLPPNPSRGGPVSSPPRCSHSRS
jgi:hypothetical protein